MKNKILKFLFDRQGGATINQIRAVGLVSGTRGTVSKCVSRLVKGGFVEDTNLSQSIPYYSLTKFGRDTCAALFPSTTETSASAVANS